MTAHRFFLVGPLPQDPEQPIPLASDDVRHAVSALRVRAGEVIDVVDPDGRVWHITVLRASADGVFGRADGAPTEVPTQPHVTLFQAVAKGEKMDEIVRRAVEIGADQIVPVLTRRCVVKMDARKQADRGERWRRVAAAAAKQARRTTVPVVDDPVKLKDALPLLVGYDAVVVLWEAHEGAGLLATLRAIDPGVSSRVALVVGPEGGLEPEEVDELVSAGARLATLGPSILRTETAALVALTLTMAALGGLGTSGE